MTTTLFVFAVVLGCGLAFALVTAAERSARETAWRRIAEERGWNHDY